MKSQNWHGNFPYVSVPSGYIYEALNFMNEDVRALKDALENLNTRKSTSRRILKGIFVENILIGKDFF